MRAIFELGRHRGNKMQMMAIGDRRFLFQAGDVIEVTDALKPVMFNRQGFAGGQLQLAYNDKLKKWILMTGAGVAGDVLDAEMAERQVRQSRPDQAQHRAEGPARRALLRCHRSGEDRAALGMELRPGRSQAPDPDRLGHPPQLLRRRPLRLSRHRARQQLHPHGKLGAPLLERHPDHRRGGPVAAEIRRQLVAARASARARRRPTRSGANTATGNRSPRCTARCMCRARSRTAAATASAPTARSA